MKNKKPVVIPMKTTLFIRETCPYCLQQITFPSSYKGKALLCGNSGCRRVIALIRKVEDDEDESPYKIEIA